MQGSVDESKIPERKPALDLIEEAIHLLRRAPSGIHICYYTGVCPLCFRCCISGPT